MASLSRVNRSNLAEMSKTCQSLFDSAFDLLLTRYISTSLRIYLGEYLHYQDGRLEPLLESDRTRYLASLPLAHLRDLTEDMLEQLFKRGGVKEHWTVVEANVILPRAIARKWLASLAEEDFNGLLVDLTYEFERRGPYLSRNGETNLGVILYGQDSTTALQRSAVVPEATYRIDRLLPQRLVVPQPSMTERLLRRALSARDATTRRLFKGGGRRLLQESENDSPEAKALVFSSPVISPNIKAAPTTVAKHNIPVIGGPTVVEAHHNEVRRDSSELLDENKQGGMDSRLRDDVATVNVPKAQLHSLSQPFQWDGLANHDTHESTSKPNESNDDAATFELPSRPASINSIETLRPILQRGSLDLVFEGLAHRASADEATSPPASIASSDTLAPLLKEDGLAAQVPATYCARRSYEPSSLELTDLLKKFGSVSKQNSRSFSLHSEIDWSFIQRMNRNSELSTLADDASFRTAFTQLRNSATLGRSINMIVESSHRESDGSYFSASSGLDPNRHSRVPGAYYLMLKEKDLIPEPLLETDWSGRGQHAEYSIEEKEMIPLTTEKILGQTRNALVESVRCRRIRLARKTIRCTKWSGVNREDALREVQHLHRTQHTHIVRLVGTYVVGQDLAILMYPCAEWNLQSFMEQTYSAPDVAERCTALTQFISCLANVLAFMHSFPLKHMDIKPTNLLVRNVRQSSVNGPDSYKIYITDFGISRSYTSLEESETETPTSFTRTYAAREVVLQELRGLAADVFSLGCVYAEILAVISDCGGHDSTWLSTATHWNALHAARRSSKNSALRAYHAATLDVRACLALCPLEQSELQAARAWACKMLAEDPAERPSARDIAEDPHLPFGCLGCTLHSGPEDFEAVEQTVDLS